MKRRIRFLVSLLLLFSNFLWSQSTSDEYVFVNIKEDISKVAVSTILQDNDGFIWIGTVGVGLYKFDGINYSSYRHVLNDSTSLSSSRIECAFLDNRNNFWVGTENGLNLYDRDLDKFIRVKIEKKP